MENVEDEIEGSFKLGQTFSSAKEAREAVHLYGIQNGYKLRFVKNEKTRLRVVCVNTKSCPFLFYCSKIGNDGGVAVKTLILEHNCYKQREVPSLTQAFLANHFKNRVYKDPKYTAKQIQEDVKIQFKLHVSLFKCKRARKTILTELNGNIINEFKTLEAYIQILKDTNPGSNVELQLSKEGEEKGLRVFRRLFVMLDACKRNWLGGCRPIICLDGCHLKSMAGGVLLTAVGKDANDGIMPLAWAVVSKENKVNWTWFMKLMKRELDLGEGDRVTIISDMQKGLINAVETILPRAEHRWCARHIYANWSKKWRGPELKKRFWICAWSSYEEEFKENLVKVGDIKQKAAEELVKYPPQTWCRAYQDFRSSSYMVDNNASESFNSSLLEAMSKPIISMLEDIRVLVMNRFRERKRSSNSWKGDWSPTAMRVFQAAKEDSISCQVLWNGDNGYEVGEGLDKHTVLLDRRLCTCRNWGLCGIPCQHAIAASYHSKIDPETMISHWYHKETYEKSYAHTVQPVPGPKFYKTDAHLPIEPPIIEKKIGRPKKHRVRATNESRQKAHKLSRIGQVQFCSICKSSDHKKNHCPNASSHALSSQASNSNAPNKGRAGLGVHVNLDTGKTTINPGMPSERVVSLGHIPTQDSSDPQVRYPIPNERGCKRKYKEITFTKAGNEERMPSNLPFKPPGLKWKGKSNVTTTALMDEAVAKRTRFGKAKSSQSSIIHDA
ncbi:uncharacterized protein LOC130993960 [Salvia miltiorrhiza]|uniref:uncharacterized protein LOC130993960 n=1 Tax=Salvia miltiorrhiza TaxID=226208 RepID=UPI0025AB80A2|nr:uncharacterized protein LOC130993960 [Salvia miltiorrhiza]